MIATAIIVILFFVFFLGGIRIVRPTERGLIETLGKYSGFAASGFNWIIPVFQSLRTVDITESMSDIEPQEIITEDNLNAKVDLVVYYKIKSDEESVKKSQYAVSDIIDQLTTLARTTARNVIGTMKFGEVNSKRSALNTLLAETLATETDKWGIEVTKIELKEIVPPKDVQDAMNNVIKAENMKRAAIDVATAKETEADGIRRAAIKEAEGKRQGAILEAEGLQQSKVLVAKGEAEAFDLINKSFTGNAQLLKKLEVTESSMKNNSKIIISEGGVSPNLILGNLT